MQKQSRERRKSTKSLLESPWFLHSGQIGWYMPRSISAKLKLNTFFVKSVFGIATTVERIWDRNERIFRKKASSWNMYNLKIVWSLTADAVMPQVYCETYACGHTHRRKHVWSETYIYIYTPVVRRRVHTGFRDKSDRSRIFSELKQNVARDNYKDQVVHLTDEEKNQARQALIIDLKNEGLVE